MNNIILIVVQKLKNESKEWMNEWNRRRWRRRKPWEHTLAHTNKSS